MDRPSGDRAPCRPTPAGGTDPPPEGSAGVRYATTLDGEATIRGNAERSIERGRTSWAGYAAAAWAAGYGLLAASWALGLPGFPYGEGDVVDARNDSWLWSATAAGTAPWIAAACVAGIVVGIASSRSPARWWVVGACATAAAGLLVVVPGMRLLTLLGYAPVLLVGGPAGLLPPGTVARALSWTTVNQLVVVAGGVLFAAAAVVAARRSRGACVTCGRSPGRRSGWTDPASAARWGRVAGWVAFGAPFVYATIRWAWVLRIPVLADDDMLRWLHDSGAVWMGAVLATFGAAGGVLALGLHQRWGEVWPRWVPGVRGRPVPRAFPLVAASVVTVALAPSASCVVLRVAEGRGGELLGDPLVSFPVWAAALGVAALGHHFRTRGACDDCGAGDRPGPRSRPRVVVVGGGFAGLRTVQGLRRADVDVVLVDRRNHHLFQPLLYQVATGALGAGEIATPLRGLLERQRNASVVLGDVVGVDLDRRSVTVVPTTDPESPGPRTLGYDTLVVAAGAGSSWFGHERWRRAAPGLTTIEDAVEIRRRVLGAFEAAELTADPERRRELLTFAVVGAGPTGVETAGQIAELARDTLRRDFRRIDPTHASILLVEAADRVLPTFAPTSSARAGAALRRRGVTPVLGHVVTDLGPGSVTIRGDGPSRCVRTGAVVWAAGVHASPLGDVLAAAAATTTDHGGRVRVGPDLTLDGHPEVLVLGDMADVHDEHGRPQRLPGVAPAAMQAGRYAATSIRNRLRGRATRPFRYRDKGSVATVGRMAAVADLRGVHVSGPPAWFLYLGVHLFYLLGLQNRALVLLRWTVTFVTGGRGTRLITGAARADAGVPSDRSWT